MGVREHSSVPHAYVHMHVCMHTHINTHTRTNIYACTSARVVGLTKRSHNDPPHEICIGKDVVFQKRKKKDVKKHLDSSSSKSL